jgi:hypothetical protein
LTIQGAVKRNNYIYRESNDEVVISGWTWLVISDQLAAGRADVEVGPARSPQMRVAKCKQSRQNANKTVSLKLPFLRSLPSGHAQE